MKYYMCSITREWELGHTDCTNFIDTDLENFKEKHSCWEQCGIVEVETQDGCEPTYDSPYVQISPQLGWGMSKD